jgi:F-type H+-transporting ATPase subunit gamma
MQQGAQNTLHPLLDARETVKAVGLVLITADKGLCGAYNANMLRVASRFILDAGVPIRLIAVGRRGAAFMARYQRDLMSEFSGLPPQPRLVDISPIAHTAISAFLSSELDEVFLGYTQFVSTLIQRPVIRRLLPLRTVGANDEPRKASTLVREEESSPMVGEYIYEPDPQTILDAVLPRFTEIQIYQAVLEALASEHSARMVAMQAATDNANDLLAHLTLSYNKARQNAITREMLDIAGGVEAMKQAG